MMPCSRIAAVVLFAATFLATSNEASIPYFSDVRDVTISTADRQNYVVLDPEVWERARPDLADIRLYDGHAQIPYVLRQRTARMSSVEQPAKILNLGRVGDHTEFDLDVSGVEQYDRVRVEIEGKDFVNAALLFGKHQLGPGKSTQLGPATLYDFSREKLGSNAVLSIPTSSFHYLHVQLSPGIGAEQVKSASVFDVQEQKAAWTKVGICGAPVQQAKTTTFECEVQARAPLDRLQFEIPSNALNFRRNVSLADSNGRQIANGNISRVRMTHSGHKVSSEELAVSVFGPHKERVVITIQNGDDAPLPISAVEPQAIERRIHFDPNGKSFLKLYYGDPKLEPPVYDYANFFEEDTAAVPAQLGPGMHNAEYRGRPDERPWSERHKSVLWVAMLAAVALLAALAVRGLRTTSVRA
jgi:hypothetical protein